MISKRSVPRTFRLLAIFGFAVLAGCVPYQKYDKLRAELDRANRVNEDLVNRLNQEMVKNKSGVLAEAGVSQTAYDQMAAENARLQKLLAEARNQSNFTEEDRASLGGKVALEDGGLALGSDLLFDSGVATLRKGHLAVLDSVAELLKSKYAGEKIIVEGHTDNEPLNKTKGLFEDNWNLGYHRARAVFKYFKTEHGIPEDQMVLVTYGFMKPVASNYSDDGRARNRRVVIRRGGEIRGVLSRN